MHARTHYRTIRHSKCSQTTTHCSYDHVHRFSPLERDSPYTYTYTYIKRLRNTSGMIHIFRSLYSQHLTIQGSSVLYLHLPKRWYSSTLYTCRTCDQSIEGSPPKTFPVKFVSEKPIHRTMIILTPKLPCVTPSATAIHEAH